MATLMAGVYLGRPWNIIVPVVAMGISDFVIGNSSIFIFTWSAYAIIGIMATLSFWSAAIESKGAAIESKIGMATVLAATSSLFFFLWTNFGVWAQGWYPPTLQGLISSYIMGLPFLKYNLIGNLVIVPVGFGVVELVKNRVVLYRTTLEKRKVIIAPLPSRL